MDANNSSRIFNITATTGDFTLAGLTLTGGRTTGDNAYPALTFSGGAIRSLSTGSLTIDRSVVSGNSTPGGQAGGGGISSPGAVLLTNSTVSGNSTAGDFARGGGIQSSGDVTLTSSTVSGNSTLGRNANGGGIAFVASDNITLTNSTVSGNMTMGLEAYGGGIYANLSIVTLFSSTVTDNHTIHATSAGGGIWINSSSIFLPNIRHSIVSGNSVGSGTNPDIRPAGSNFTANFSLLGTLVFPTSGSGNIFNNNPQLGPLANNGGPTDTHALLVGSPAIDSGDPSFTSPPDFDQRGAPFVRVSRGRIDIGAIEDQPIVVNSENFDGDNDIDGADFLAWQRGFGTPNANKPDGDADNDNNVDVDDLVVWSSQFGQSAPVASVTAQLAGEPVATTNLISAAMAVVVVHSGQVAETPMLVEEPSFAETYADRVFTDDVIAPAGVFADNNALPDTNPSNIDATESPWLADELLEPVFG